MIIDSISQTPANPTPPSTLITIIGDTVAPQSGYINEYSAMTVPAFYSGVRFISETLASFAMGVFQDDGGARTKADHPLNQLLSRKINAYSTPFLTLQTWYHHQIIWGNGYLWRKRDRKGNTM